MGLEDGILSPPLPTVTLLNARGQPFIYATTRSHSIPYIELDEGYGENFSPNEQTGTRVCCCKWNDRYAFVADMVGFVKYLPTNVVAGVTTNMSRSIPDQHPECPFLFCTGCELIEGKGTQLPASLYNDICKALTNTLVPGAGVSRSPNNMIAYNLATYRCKYEALPYAVYDDASAPADPLSLGIPMGELSRFIQRTPEPGADNLKLPGGQLKFASDGQTINEPPAQPVPTMELTYIWHQVPVLPWQTIRQTMGKVNNAPFDPTYINAATETLLCNAPIIWLGRTACGDFNYKITYKFSYRPNYALDGVTEQGWNYFYRRKVAGTGAGGYDGPVVDRIDPTKKAFMSADFTQLFVLPASGGYG